MASTCLAHNSCSMHTGTKIEGSVLCQAVPGSMNGISKLILNPLHANANTRPGLVEGLAKVSDSQMCYFLQ